MQDNIHVKKHTHIDTRVALLEQSIYYINEDLKDIKNLIKHAACDLKEEINTIRREHKHDFRWLLGLIITLNAGLFGTMAHGFHWI